MGKLCLQNAMKMHLFWEEWIAFLFDRNTDHIDLPFEVITLISGDKDIAYSLGIFPKPYFSKNQSSFPLQLESSREASSCRAANYRIETCVRTCVRFPKMNYLLVLSFKDFIFTERAREGEREGEEGTSVCERNSHQWPLPRAPTKDLAAPRACAPNGEPNRPPYTVRGNSQPTEPHHEHFFRVKSLLL